MPRAKPKVEKTCLVCNSTFLGTPKSTRCQPCRTAGHKTTTAMRRAKIEADEAKVPRRLCRECRSTFRIDPTDPEALFCPICSDHLAPVELSPEEQASLRAEARINRIKEHLAQQTEWLDRREKKPKGHRAMSSGTAKTPLGILWLDLAAADGAAASVMYTSNTDVSDEDKVHLLSSFFRLRAKGFHPDAIAKLCPEALLKDEAQSALQDLPPVSADSDEDDHWSPEQIEGDTCLSRELAEITERQDRRRAQIALGLAT